MTFRSLTWEGGGENKTTCMGINKSWDNFINPHLLKTRMSINSSIVNRIKVV